MRRISGRLPGSREEPADQRTLERPRLGYFGVIDERMDLALSMQSRRHGRSGRS